MNQKKTKNVQTGTLGKIIAVLDVIAESGQPIRFTDVLVKVGQPRGTIHRHLTHLLEENLVILNPDGSYELGTHLLKLASNAWKNNSVRRIAEPFIVDLQNKTGETVHLALLQGSSVIYMDKMESNQSVRMHSQIGNTSPVYCTGVGKAMLSALPDADIEELIPEFEFYQFTEFTITNAKTMRAEIKQIREQGYAEDREELELGIRCVAAPVVNNNGKLFCGISITAPAYRIKDETLKRWKTWVKETTQLIGTKCSNELGPRT